MREMAQREKESAQGDRDRRDRSTTQDKFPEVPVHEHVPENDTRAREEEEAIEPTVNPAVQPTSESLADPTQAPPADSTAPLPREQTVVGGSTISVNSQDSSAVQSHGIATDTLDPSTSVAHTVGVYTPAELLALRPPQGVACLPPRGVNMGLLKQLTALGSGKKKPKPQAKGGAKGRGGGGAGAKKSGGLYTPLCSLA